MYGRRWQTRRALFLWPSENRQTLQFSASPSSRKHLSLSRSTITNKAIGNSYPLSLLDEEVWSLAGFVNFDLWEFFIGIPSKFLCRETRLDTIKFPIESFFSMIHTRPVLFFVKEPITLQWFVRHDEIFNKPIYSLPGKRTATFPLLTNHSQRNATCPNRWGWRNPLHYAADSKTSQLPRGSNCSIF